MRLPLRFHLLTLALLTLWALLLPGCDRAALSRRLLALSPGELRVHTDLLYAQVEDLSLHLDAYLPPGPGPYPALILLHGGAWAAGSKADMADLARRAAAAGVAAFSVQYRLSHQAPYPAAVEDCVLAARWIRHHVDYFRVDPDRLGALGVSAGGHLALMLATLPPGERDRDAAGQPLANWVRAAVSFAGPTDLTDTAAWDEVPLPLRGVLTAFLGGTPQQVPDNYRQASPVTHVTPGDPPVLLIHGDQDQVVPYSQALIMRQRLQEAGVPVELMTLHGAGHSLDNANPLEVAAALLRMVTFLQEHLADPQPAP